MAVGCNFPFVVLTSMFERLDVNDIRQSLNWRLAIELEARNWIVMRMDHALHLVRNLTR